MQSLLCSAISRFATKKKLQRAAVLYIAFNDASVESFDYARASSLGIQKKTLKIAVVFICLIDHIVTDMSVLNDLFSYMHACQLVMVRACH